MIQTINKYWLNSFVGACILLVLAIDVQAQNLSTTWERSARTGAAEVAPAWFTAGSVRGMAYGTVGGNERVYAADRANNTIRVMDAATGADITPTTAFDLSGVGGGTFPMNDVEVSDDGVIFLGNLAGDASTSPFRLYWWTSEGGAYADSLTITTSSAQRIGDKFTVKGSVADNSVEIWLPVSGSNPGIVYVLTTTDNGATWDIDTITLSGSNVAIPSNSDATPLELGRMGDFYIVGNGTSPKRYDSNGVYIADSQFPAANYTGSRNGLSSFMYNGESHLSVYTYRLDGTNTGNKIGRVYVYNVSDTTSPMTVAESPLMGDDADGANAIHGEANVRVNMDGTYDVFALDGANGFAAYNYEPEKFDVTFQADMSGFIDSAAFIPGEDYVTVAGSMNGWDASADTLTDGDGDGIYSKTLSLTADTYFYKFVVDAGRLSPSPTYENGDNREVVVTKDTTLVSDEPNVPYSDLTGATFGEVQLFFQVNMEVQILNGNFDPNNSEHNVVVAGGMNGWSTTANKLTAGQTEGIYETTITINPAAIPQNWAYKFVLNNGETLWESGADKIIGVTEANLFEGKYVAVNNTGTPPFFDGITLDDIFAQETEVVFEVDLRPAYYHLADSMKLPEDVQISGQSGVATSIDFLAANGPLVTGGGWDDWGNGLGNDPDLVLNDNGEDGDLVAGDSVWSFTRTFAVGEAKKGAFKFGVNGLDNEAGVGADHSLTIEGDRVSFIFGAVVRADSTYDDLYDPYILATESGPVVVRRGGENDNGITIPTETIDEPGRFELNQNYPNPFNPSTNISFTLPVSSQVTLKVYNLLGQEVATLVNGRLGSGPHTVQFDASGLSSGMYLYRIEAGSFVQNKKMMLIK
ncbi:MAG: T9SS type A sorting domain-containing protein [Balneola sp.]